MQDKLVRAHAVLFDGVRNQHISVGMMIARVSMQ